MKRKYTRYSDAFKEKVVEYSKTHSYIATMKKYGIARQTFYDWRRIAGLDMYSAELKLEIVEYSKTHTYKQTMKKYSMARQTLNDWRRRAGLTKPGVRKLEDVFWFDPNARLNPALMIGLHS